MIASPLTPQDRRFVATDAGKPALRVDSASESDRRTAEDGRHGARHACWTPARPHPVGIGKFGIGEDCGIKNGKKTEAPIALDYRLLRDAVPFLLPLHDTGQVRVAEEEDGVGTCHRTDDR